jgi:hypothetical protein
VGTDLDIGTVEVGDPLGPRKAPTPTLHAFGAKTDSTSVSRDANVGALTIRTFDLPSAPGDLVEDGPPLDVIGKVATSGLSEGGRSNEEKRHDSAECDDRVTL